MGVCPSKAQGFSPEGTYARGLIHRISDATPGNYTCTNLAEHLEGDQSQSHDVISDFLRREKVTPRRLWKVVGHLLEDSASSYLVVDDSVQDKRYSKKIELVNQQLGLSLALASEQYMIANLCQQHPETLQKASVKRKS